MQQRKFNTGQRKFGKKKFGSGQHGFRSPQDSYFISESRHPRKSSNNRRRKRSWTEEIDTSKFIRKASDVQTVETPILNQFSDFSFCSILKDNLAKRNYNKPTPIQDKAIKHIMDGRDLIGLANTGTGKTAAFLLPLINKVFADRTQKVLILAPTRELALQIDNEFRNFSWSMKIFSAVCVGGSPIHKQIGHLKRNPNFVIGTPGRLKDLSDRRQIRFESFNNVVIDEIDRMLDMGFIEDIRKILEVVPAKRQSLFFSATMPGKIKDLVKFFLVDPITIEVKSSQTTDNVDQDIVRVRSEETKFLQLKDILNQQEMKKVLIFIETKHEVEKMANNLKSNGFRADSIHGDKKQNQRQKALSLFRSNAIDILVATDVAARGLDINDVSHVINYTIPQTYTDYIHRIGRTGRGDKKGFALTFVS